MSGYRRYFVLRNSTGDHFKVDSALGERSVILVECVCRNYRKKPLSSFLSELVRSKQFHDKNGNNRETIKLSLGENRKAVAFSVLEMFEFKICK